MPTPILGLPYPVSADTADVPRDIKALADKIDPLGIVPVGALMMWPLVAPPNSAWLICDGHPVLVADYPALANVLGSQGGQITLPNLSNRVPVGPGENPLLGTGGAKEVTLTAAQSGLPAHNHGGVSGLSNTNLNHTHSFTTGGAGAHSHKTLAGWTFVIATGASVESWLLGTNSIPGQASVRATGNGVFGSSDQTTQVGDHQHGGLTDAAGVDHGHAINNEVARNAAAPVAIEQRFLVVNFIIRAL